MSTERVTVAVCSFRRYRGMSRSLHSLVSQITAQFKFKILVVDNAPIRQGDALRAIQRDPGIAGIETIVEPRPGVSYARNCAMEHCETELLAFLDDDCLAASCWLQQLVETFDRSEPGVGAVGGKVIGRIEGEIPHWLSRTLRTYLSIVDWGEEPRDVHSPMWLSGGNIMFSASKLREVGGFKPHLGRRGSLLLSNEEIEVCNSLRSAGYRVIYEPKAWVEHSISPNRVSQQWFRKRVFWQAISDILLESGTSTGVKSTNFHILKKYCWEMKLIEVTADQSSSELFQRQLRVIYELARYLTESAEEIHCGESPTNKNNPAES